MTLSVNKSVKRWGLYIPKWFGITAEECSCSKRAISMPSGHPCSPKLVQSGSLDSPFDQISRQFLSNDISPDVKRKTKENSADRPCDNFSDYPQRDAVVNSSVESLSANISDVYNASDHNISQDMLEADYCDDIASFTQPNWGNETKKEIATTNAPMCRVNTMDAACQTIYSSEGAPHVSLHDLEESGNHSVDLPPLDLVYSELIGFRDEDISQKRNNMRIQSSENTCSTKLPTNLVQDSPQARCKSQPTSNLAIKIPDDDWTIHDGIESRPKLVTPNVYTTPDRPFQNSEHIYKELFQNSIDEGSDTDNDDIYESIFEVLANKTENCKEENISHKEFLADYSQPGDSIRRQSNDYSLPDDAIVEHEALKSPVVKETLTEEESTAIYCFPEESSQESFQQAPEAVQTSMNKSDMDGYGRYQSTRSDPSYNHLTTWTPNNKLNSPSAPIETEDDYSFAEQATQQNSYEAPWDLKSIEDKLEAVHWSSNHPTVKDRSATNEQVENANTYEEPWDSNNIENILSRKSAEQNFNFQGNESGTYEEPWDSGRLDQKIREARRCSGDAQRNQMISSNPRSPTTKIPDLYEEPWDTRALSDFMPKMRSEAANPSQSRSSISGAETFDPNLSLELQSWYHPNVDRIQAQNSMLVCKEGSYLVRNSTSGVDFTLGIKSGGSMMNIRIKRVNGGFVVGENSKTFKTIPLMISYYSNTKLPVVGTEHVMLMYPIRREDTQS